MNKTISLVVVVAVIFASIFYLQSMKATFDDTNQEVVIDSGGSSEFRPLTTYVPDQDKIRRSDYSLAPDLEGISGYINSEEFKLEELRGKVVLIDFWTYTCINCIRTQPYLNAWYDAYTDDGLVIVGVHTPEFEFEKDFDNVKDAVEKAGIKYPVVQDNNYQTWRAFQNRFWPRKYLIDIDGLIRYDHAGEGAYEETEDIIQQLLQERSEKLNLQVDMQASNPNDITGVDFRRIATPEIYFGYTFARGNLGSPEGFTPELVNTYSVPDQLEASKAYLVGEWLNKGDYSESVSNGTILIVYSAKAVNIVASSGERVELSILLDSAEIKPEDVGSDGIIVSEEKLYNIITTPDYGAHSLEIAVPAGFRIYTFTFG